MQYVVALGCAIGIALGQVLFKQAALGLKSGDGLLAIAFWIPLFGALTTYCLTSLAWVWVLRTAELARAYPIMALAFVMVPLASHFLYGERLSPQYFIGIILILCGIAVALRY